MIINPKESEKSDFISQIDKSPEDKQENLVSCVLSPENNDKNKSDVNQSRKRRDRSNVSIPSSSENEMGDVSNGDLPSSLKIRKLTKGFKINKKLRYNPAPNTHNLKRRADTVPKMDTSVIKSHAAHEWIDRSNREATDLLRENLDLSAGVEKLKTLLKQSTHESAAKAGNAVPNRSAVATQNRFEALSDRMDDNAPSASSPPKDFLAKLKESNNHTEGRYQEQGLLADTPQQQSKPAIK